MYLILLMHVSFIRVFSQFNDFKNCIWLFHALSISYWPEPTLQFMIVS